MQEKTANLVNLSQEAVKFCNQLLEKKIMKFKIDRREKNYKILHSVAAKREREMRRLIAGKYREIRQLDTEVGSSFEK